MSSFKILWNTGLACAESLNNSGVGSVESGYHLQDGVMGARNRILKMAPTDQSQAVAFDFNEDIPLSHMIVARADLLKTQQGMDLSILTKDAVDAWLTTATFPDFDSDLIGPKYQDFVTPFLQTGLRGVRFQGKTNGPDAESMAFSKVYFSNAFDFGIEPDLDPAPSWQLVSGQDSEFRPLRGYRSFATSHIITLSWTNLGGMAVENFKAIPKLLEWPIFLYDPMAHIWPWKLEHVVIDSYTETTRDNDSQDLTVTFRRLKHYL